MRGILINSYDRSITEVETTGHLADMYQLLRVSMVEVVHLEHDDLWVDEEGLLTITQNTMFFKLEGIEQPIAGSGLILSADAQGECVSTKMDIEELENKISFLTVKQIMEMYR